MYISYKVSPEPGTVNNLGNLYADQMGKLEEMFLRALRGSQKAVVDSHPTRRKIARDLRACSAARCGPNLQRSWVKRAFAALTVTALLATPLPPVQSVALEQPSTPTPETVLTNGATVHRPPDVVAKVEEVVNAYRDLWKDQGFVKLPEDDWMRIPLNSDWEDKVTVRAKVYPLCKPNAPH